MLRNKYNYLKKKKTVKSDGIKTKKSYIFIIKKGYFHVPFL